MKIGAMIAASLLTVTALSAENPAARTYPLWDGRETQAEYAKRVGIGEAAISVDLGNGVTMPFVLIPAGRFIMGASVKSKASELPVHEVTLTRPFYLSACTVTREQVAQLGGTGPGAVKEPKLPASETWPSAVDGCRKIGEKAGRTGRLPTEAEWEYACRAGSTNSSFFGEDDKSFSRAAEVAWFGSNAVGQVHAVGLKPPNPWGLYDLYGNVLQWVSDWYAPYTAEAAVDPQGPAEGKSRVLRGSPIDRSPARSSSRTQHPPSATAKFGFRAVLDVK